MSTANRPSASRCNSRRERSSRTRRTYSLSLPRFRYAPERAISCCSRRILLGTTRVCLSQPTSCSRSLQPMAAAHEYWLNVLTWREKRTAIKKLIASPATYFQSGRKLEELANTVLGLCRNSALSDSIENNEKAAWGQFLSIRAISQDV